MFIEIDLEKDVQLVPKKKIEHASRACLCGPIDCWSILAEQNFGWVSGGGLCSKSVNTVDPHTVPLVVPIFWHLNLPPV